MSLVPEANSTEAQEQLVSKAADQILTILGQWVEAGLKPPGVVAAFCTAVSLMETNPNTAVIARIIRIRIGGGAP